ncbi:substrate-binding periplasmic protein, partial [Escherichia coli]
MSLDPAIRSGKDLAGKTVSVQTGTTYMQYMEKNLPGIKRLVNFPTNEAARNALLSKRVDAWVTERFIAKELQQKNPNAQLKQG